MCTSIELREYTLDLFTVAMGITGNSIELMSGAEWRSFVLHVFAKPVDTKEVSVLAYEYGKLIETGKTAVLTGIAAGYEDAFYLEWLIDVPESIDDLVDSIDAAIKAVSHARKGCFLCPTHAGHSQQVTVGTTQMLKLELLFANNGIPARKRVDGSVEVVKSCDFARMNATHHHEKENSVVLGTGRVAVVSDGVFGTTWDGAMVARRSSFMTTGPVMKVDAWADRTSALTTPQDYIKGMCLFLEDGDFEAFAAQSGIPYDELGSVDILAPAVSVKYSTGTDRLDTVQLVSIMDHMVSSEHVSLSVQAAERVPLTDHGRKVIESTWKERVGEIMSAYTDPTGQEIANLLGLIGRDMLDDAEEELDESTFATLKKDLRVLKLRGPQDTSAYVNSTLPILLEKRLKRLFIRGGLTVVALPGFNLKPSEVRLPSGYARKYGITRGDVVTAMRNPNTGIEMASVKVVGFTGHGAVEIDPAFWASRFSGDFDGDLIGIIPIGNLVDDAAIRPALSAKSKGKGEFTIIEAVARSFYSKLMIPYFDLLLTVGYERGGNIESAASNLQACIDSVKHAVDVPSKLDAARDVLGDIKDVPNTSAIAALLRGRLSKRGYRGKDRVAIRYNILVHAIKERPARGWMASLENSFRYLTFANRKVVDLIKDADDGDKSASYLLGQYRDAMTDAGCPRLSTLKSNFEKSSYVDARIINTNKSFFTNALNEADDATRLLARRIYKNYKQWHKSFGSDDCWEYLDRARKLAAGECGDKAMFYLFGTVALQIPDAYIRIKSLAVLYYMPDIVGKYNLAQYFRKMGVCHTYTLNVR